VYVNEALSRACVFEWHKRFREELETMMRDRPSIRHTHSRERWESPRS